MWRGQAVIRRETNVLILPNSPRSGNSSQLPRPALGRFCRCTGPRPVPAMFPLGENATRSTRSHRRERWHERGDGPDTPGFAGHSKPQRGVLWPGVRPAWSFLGGWAPTLLGPLPPPPRDASSTNGKIYRPISALIGWRVVDSRGRPDTSLRHYWDDAARRDTQLEGAAALVDIHHSPPATSSSSAWWRRGWAARVSRWGECGLALAADCHGNRGVR